MKTTIQDKYNHVMSVWSIQESLLQSYRNLFLTSESVLISISTFICTTKYPGYNFLLIPLGIFLLFLMKNLTIRRGLGVNYCEIILQQIEKEIYDSNRHFMIEFEDFMNLPRKTQRSILEEEKVSDSIVKDITRKYINSVLIGLLFAIWIAIIVITILSL